MALVQTGGEDITVSNTKIGPTAAKVVDKVVMASFQHLSGGKIFMQTFADPTAGGTNGDFEAAVTDKWNVWGHDEIRDFLMIRQATDATVAVQYFGTGKT